MALMTLGCLGILAGLGLARLWQLDQLWLLVLAAGLLAACRRRLWWVAVPAVILAGILIGLWRGSVVAAQVADYAHFVGKKVVVTGMVAEDPTYGDDSQQVMMLQNVAVNGQNLPGQIRVKSLGIVEPQRGDQVRAGGKLYDGFSNYQASLYYADLSLVAAANDPVNWLRHWFAASLRSLLPDTEAGLGLGFLIGVKSQLPDDLNTQLKLLGLTHIVVASGYNLTVLVRLARRLFANVSHFLMTAASLGMIFGFVLVAGLSSSMSRAALVCGLCVVAWYYGRRVHPALLISMVAALTALVNPLYLWTDIGWWLSFLSFAGVMLLAPLVQRRLYGAKRPKLVGQVVIETICAQALTLPLTVLIFGNLSVLSLVANVLVVPLIPLAMLLTFVAGTAGALLPLVAWPAIWLLRYLIMLIATLSQISWASLPFKISPEFMLGAYALLVFFGFLLWRKIKHDYLSQSVIE